MQRAAMLLKPLRCYVTEMLLMSLGCNAAALLLASIVSSAAAGPSEGPPGLDLIESAGLMRTVERLSAPELDGRLAAGPGFMRAAREMADRFRDLGLEPGGEDGYFQNLSVEYNDIDSCGLSLIGADGAEHRLVPGRDFTCRGLTGSGDLRAPVVFVGYGLSRPEKGYDDYAGIDVRGKIVLAFKEAPPFQADSSGWGESWMPRPKGAVAASHGARALLIVSRPLQERPQKPIGSMLEGEAPQNDTLPRLQIDLSVAEEMAAAAGFTLAGLESRVDSTHAPFSRDLPASARIFVRARYEASRPTVNVVGILRGSDERLRRECLVLGAHLDHVGRQGRSVYFPGANDNASGAAAVLAMAEAFSRCGVRPRRSVLFCLWSSEEAGLFGSRRFVERPPVPDSTLVAYFNFDCVSHGDSIEVGGGKEYPRLWGVARELDAGDRKRMVAETGNGGGADAQPFESAHVPNLYFASKFSYTHLHLPTDQPATLNPSLLEAIARLGYRCAWRVAEGAPTRD